LPLCAHFGRFFGSSFSKEEKEAGEEAEHDDYRDDDCGCDVALAEAVMGGRLGRGGCGGCVGCSGWGAGARNEGGDGGVCTV